MIKRPADAYTASTASRFKLQPAINITILGFASHRVRYIKVVIYGGGGNPDGGGS